MGRIKPDLSGIIGQGQSMGHYALTDMTARSETALANSTNGSLLGGNGCGVFATPERTNHALNPKSLTPKCGPQPQELLHQISAGGDHHRQKGHSLFEKFMHASSARRIVAE